MDESLFLQEGCIEGTFPLDLECKFHIACKAENHIKIDGNFVIKGSTYCSHFSFTFYMEILCRGIFL